MLSEAATKKDDQSYRYRIYTKIRSNGGANESALRFELLKVPGIQDIVFERHAGAYTCYVYAITPVASASLLADIQEVLNEKSAFPLTGTAVIPTWWVSVWQPPSDSLGTLCPWIRRISCC